MSASVELADHGITANMVHPPVTDTGWVNDEVRETVRTSRDHVHIATPEQVAEVIDFLASDAGELVTGNVIVPALTLSGYRALAASRSRAMAIRAREADRALLAQAVREADERVGPGSGAEGCGLGWMIEAVEPLTRSTGTTA